MGKMNTERIVMDGATKNELDFKLNVNVTKDGFFTAQLPEHIAELFASRGIELKTRLRGTPPGYYIDDTYDKLIKNVKKDCEAYVSRKLIRESIVIDYIIKTTCAYLVSEEGEFVPNGRWVNDRSNPKHDWRNGTEHQYAATPHPFGVEMFVRPMYKREYQYKSGKQKTEYDWIYEENCTDNQPNLKWLAGICSMSKPDGGRHREIAYTEPVAAWFVNFVKAICMMNENLMQMIEPEDILKLANDGSRLLMFNNQTEESK